MELGAAVAVGIGEDALKGAGGFHAGLALDFLCFEQGVELLFKLLDSLFEGGDGWGLLGVGVELGGESEEERGENGLMGVHEVAFSRERGTSLRNMGAPSRPKASRSWFLR